MSIYIAEDGEDKWIVKCAPQAATDILVQVTTVEDESRALFTFQLGELLREEIEGHVCVPDGQIAMDDTRAAVIERWADQLECYARLLRCSLRPRIQPEPDP